MQTDYFFQKKKKSCGKRRKHPKKNIFTYSLIAKNNPKPSFVQKNISLQTNLLQIIFQKYLADTENVCNFAPSLKIKNTNTVQIMPVVDVGFFCTKKIHESYSSACAVAVMPAKGLC